MAKHIYLYLALIILLIPFGCGKKAENPATTNAPDSAGATESAPGSQSGKTPQEAGSGGATTGEMEAGLPNAPEGFKPIESEGRDAETKLWKEIEHVKSGIRLRLIPAGEFDMGSPDNEEYRVAGPVHHVKIGKAFYMGKYEVTQAQWKAIMGAGNNPSLFKGDDLPVETVRWNDTQDFLKKAGDGLRLPTEAEWEYACRAGNRTAWCFGDYGNALGDYAWYDKNSGNKTHRVGDRKPNDFGLYDMYGNVWEWCEDMWHGNYNDAPNDGSAWTTGGDEKSYRVIRGGGWGNSALGARSANRNGEADGGELGIGFRVVVSARANP